MAIKKAPAKRGATTASEFRSHGKEIRSASSGVVLAWLGLFLTMRRDKWVSVKDFSEAYVKANAGTDADIYTADSVRVTLGVIKWAEENIIGGAKSCRSIQHIIDQKKDGKAPAKKAKPVFNASKEAQKYTTAQLKAMLAAKGK